MSVYRISSYMHVCEWVSAKEKQVYVATTIGLNQIARSGGGPCNANCAAQLYIVTYQRKIRFT